MLDNAFTSTYGALPAHFFACVKPTPVAAPRLIKFNWDLAGELGLDLPGASDAQLADIFSGNRLVDGSQPLAMAYAGHQFGQFVPQLGDGRAILLGEVVDRAGQRRDIQLKGSGRTPFSRGGDGRAAVGPVLREYLLSEAMYALRIPATRALAAVTTGEAVYRETRLPGAILTRVAASHTRVGTFQFFAARGDTAALRQLADYVIARNFAEIGGAENPYLALLRAVIGRQASLIAKWMSVGFIHGVMNTDNMAVSGETIDFGPCAFMEAYDPDTVFSSIDRMGRYAYRNQPAAAQWNLARFAETLLPLIDADEQRAVEAASAELATFGAAFDARWLDIMRLKLGLATVEEGDATLVRTLLDAMQHGGADFTLAFRKLCGAADGPAGLHAFTAQFGDASRIGDWLSEWNSRVRREPHADASRSARMRSNNPLVIPRNHRVEEVIAAAMSDDFAPFEALLAALRAPFDEQPRFAKFAVPAAPAERVTQTFCGT